MAEGHTGHSSQGQHSDATTQDRGGEFWEIRNRWARELANCEFSRGPAIESITECTARLLVILLCGGDKASQSKDIVRAKKFWVEWKRRQP